MGCKWKESIQFPGHMLKYPLSQLLFPFLCAGTRMCKFPVCGLQTISSSITWEVVRNANSWVLPWLPKIRNSGVGSESPPGDLMSYTGTGKLYVAHGSKPLGWPDFAQWAKNGFHVFKELQQLPPAQQKQTKVEYVTKTMCGLQRQRYLLYSPLQKKFTTRCAKYWELLPYGLLNQSDRRNLDPWIVEQNCSVSLTYTTQSSKQKKNKLLSSGSLHRWSALRQQLSPLPNWWNGWARLCNTLISLPAPAVCGSP